MVAVACGLLPGTWPPCPPPDPEGSPLLGSDLHRQHGRVRWPHPIRHTHTHTHTHTELNTDTCNGNKTSYSVMRHKYWRYNMLSNIPYIAFLQEIGSPAYICFGLDVGSSLAKQSHHLGATQNSRYDQGGHASALRVEQIVHLKWDKVILHQGNSNPERDPLLARCCTYSIYVGIIQHHNAQGNTIPMYIAVIRVGARKFMRKIILIFL